MNYCRLVIGCFGFQQTFEKGKQSPDRDFLNKVASHSYLSFFLLIFNQCMTAARKVVLTFIEVLAPSGYMKYAPNGWFNFCSFACAFLIKVSLLIPDGDKMFLTTFSVASCGILEHPSEGGRGRDYRPCLQTYHYSSSRECRYR